MDHYYRYVVVVVVLFTSNDLFKFVYEFIISIYAIEGNVTKNKTRCPRHGTYPKTSVDDEVC